MKFIVIVTHGVVVFACYQLWSFLRFEKPPYNGQLTVASLSSCANRVRPPIRDLDTWAPSLDTIQQDIEGIIHGPQDGGVSNSLESIYMPLFVTDNLRRKNRELQNVISCELGPIATSDTLEPFLKKIQENPTTHLYDREDTAVGFLGWVPQMILPPAQPTKRSQLLTRASDFLQVLQQLQERYSYVYMKINGDLRQDLGSITQSVCVASIQLEGCAREAKSFNQPIHRQLQKAGVTTYRLCQESLGDSQRLNELADQFRVEASVVEAAIRRTRGLLNIIKKKSLTSDADIDSYESEMMVIGQNMIKKFYGDIILPKPASI